MATLRIRTEKLRQLLADSPHGSQEQLIRAAGISRTAWNALFDETKKRVDLRVIAGVLKALDATLDDILEYNPDENAD